MKIVFLNVWGGEMQESLPAHLEELARDTDVFCLQEAHLEMKVRTSNLFVGYTELTHAKHFDGNGHFGQTIYVKDGLEIGEVGVLLAESVELGLVNYVEVRKNGEPLTIVNVHGKSRPNYKLDEPGRLAQTQAIIDHFANRAGKVIIGGDFNILPQAQSIRMFEGAGYKDLISDFKIDTTRNHLAWDRYDTKMLYSDYVFVNDAVAVSGFSVPKNELSDHLPMILEIE